MQEKVCTGCNKPKSYDLFSKNATKPDGYSSQCKSCHQLGRGTRTPPRSCVVCRKQFKVKRSDQRTCSYECGTLIQRRPAGKENGNWKGGETISSKGYVYLRQLDHPQAHKNNGYVKRANLVVEAAIGRYLIPGEEVHHKNKDRSDDSLANLQLFASNIEHAAHHAAERRLATPEFMRSLGKHIKCFEKPLPKNIQWPSNTVLQGMVKEKTLRGVAKDFGCSHVAVWQALRR